MNSSEVTNKIKRFEDLVAWQKARILAKEIYDVSRTGEFRHDYGLAGQIQRAAVSIMSNEAEGFERGSLGEFHQFLSTAKASCAELRSHLYVACDIGYLPGAGFATLLDQAEEVGRIVGGLRASIARQRTSKSQRH